MHNAYSFALAAALAAGTPPALAQAAASAADPTAAVPATSYRPLITYQPEAAPETAPDQDWAASNATVAGYDSMALTMKMKMKDMPAHEGHAEAATQPAPKERP